MRFFKHPYQKTLAWSNNRIDKTKESSKRAGILTFQKEKFDVNVLSMAGQKQVHKAPISMDLILLSASGVPTGTCWEQLPVSTITFYSYTQCPSSTNM